MKLKLKEVSLFGVPQPKKPRLTGLRLAIHKAYKKTPMYRLEVLMKEESKWARKLTIAQNKLQQARNEINKFAKLAVQETQDRNVAEQIIDNTKEICHGEDTATKDR